MTTTLLLYAATRSLPTLQTPADTVVTVVARDGLQTAAAISLVVLGVVLVAVLVLLLVLMSQLRKMDRTVRVLGRQAMQRAGPLVDRSTSVADNVEFITGALRTDVERLNASVKALAGRLQQASDRMEERIDEFNALMEVVQGEAEEIFIDAASTARGVRAGARHLGSVSASSEAPPSVRPAPGPGEPLPPDSADSEPRPEPTEAQEV